MGHGRRGSIFGEKTWEVPLMSTSEQTVNPIEHAASDTNMLTADLATKLKMGGNRLLDMCGKVQPQTAAPLSADCAAAW
jgi:hypothetical protein